MSRHVVKDIFSGGSGQYLTGTLSDCREPMTEFLGGKAVAEPVNQRAT